MKGTETAKRVNDKPLFFLILAAFLSIVLMPELAGDGMRSGLLLSARAVIPSIFPSLVLTDLLFSCDTSVIEKTVGRVFSRLFRVSERGAVAWIAGLLAGFPVGAITVANDVRAGRLSKDEGEYLLTFVTNTGPAFLVGGVGLGTFGSVRVGWTLYLLQIPVSIIVGLLFRPRAYQKERRSVHESRRNPDFVSAVVRASDNCVRIAGFVCFISVFSALLSRFLCNGLPTVIVSILLEVGNGALKAAGLASPIPAIPLAAFTVCFSGLSVVCQSIAALSGTGIRIRRFLAGKTIASLIGFLLSFILCLTK